jgi:hypothetical protein
MTSLFENGVSGILADEMGLGEYLKVPLWHLCVGVRLFCVVYCSI